MLLCWVLSETKFQAFSVTLMGLYRLISASSDSFILISGIGIRFEMLYLGDFCKTLARGVSASFQPDKSSSPE